MKMLWTYHFYKKIVVSKENEKKKKKKKWQRHCRNKGKKNGKLFCGNGIAKIEGKKINLPLFFFLSILAMPLPLFFFFSFYFSTTIFFLEMIRP